MGQGCSISLTKHFYSLAEYILDASKIRLNQILNHKRKLPFGGFFITSVRHNLKSEISIANSQPPQIASSLSYATLFYQRSYMSSFLALCHLTSRFNPELILGSPSLIYIASSLRIKHTKRIPLQYKSKIQTKSSRRIKKFKEKNTAK